MPKKEKYLSDKILDFINPAPVHYDPEEDIHTETTAKIVDNDFDEDDLSDNGAPSVFRRRNVQLIDEVDKRYAGKKVTRKSIDSFAEEKKKGQGPSSSGDDDDDQSSEDEEDENFSDKALRDFRKRNTQLEELAKRKAGKKTIKKSEVSRSEKKISSSGDDDGEQSSENEGDSSTDKEDENSENDLSENDGSEEVDSAEESDGESGSDDSQDGEDLSGVEVDDSDEDDDANVSNDFVHLATKDKDTEINKGKAIRTQLSLWDGLLEARISLQKVLVAANKLPQPAERDTFETQGGAQFTKAARTTRKAVAKLLDKLIDLREQRLKSNAETKCLLEGSNGTAETNKGSDEEILSSDGEEKSEKEPELKEKKPDRKRKLEDYAVDLAAQHSKFAAYRDLTIRRWNEKTRAATGKIGGRDFSGFEQPTLRQIEQIMSNMPRLIDRTRVKRTAFRTLGKPAVEVDVDLPPPEEVDSEIFDDSDFYHMQLRELIERKTGSEPLGRQWTMLQAARSKMKRKIDTRATKGRRLRYTPHAKLLSFMAPVPELPYNSEARNELFLSLFAA